MKYSVVIPIYNDEEVIEELYKRVKTVMTDLKEIFEIIFIDDGSRDSSFFRLKELYETDSRVKVIKQAKNFGQASSILAGLRYSSGEIIVIMDSDLQDRPEDIPVLIQELTSKNVSMSIARWESRNDTIKKKIASWIFYSFSQKITSIKYDKGLGVFRAVKRSSVKELLDVPEITGTVLSLMYWSGISYSAVPLKRDKRFAGTSGYTLGKMLKLSAERIFSYSTFPIKMMTVTGFIVGFSSIIFAIFFIIRRFFFDKIPEGWTSIIVITSFLFGLNFIFLGLLGEYIGRIYLETKKRPKYVTELVLDSSKEDVQ